MKLLGNVVILGKPNAGKSTFFNYILDENMSIISNKPQTTRKLLYKHIKLDNDYIKLFDTPGYHKSNSLLGDYINYQVRKSLKSHNLIIYLFDATSQIDTNDFNLFQELKSYNCNNILLLVTKIDLIKNKDDANKNISILSNYFHFNKIFNISFFDNSFKKDLIQNIKELLIDKKDYYINDFKEEQEILENEIFRIEEIIRSVIIQNFKKEVPYSTAIKIYLFKYEKEKNTLFIHSDIIVEKESQKPILIGKQGKAIKMIGTKSRKIIELIYDCKIFLNLNVKVKNKWRNNKNFLKDLGYSN